MNIVLSVLLLNVRTNSLFIASKLEENENAKCKRKCKFEKANANWSLIRKEI